MSGVTSNLTAIARLHEICTLPFESHSYFLQKIIQDLTVEETLEFIKYLCDGTTMKQPAAELTLAAFLRFEELQLLLTYERLVALYKLAGEQSDPYLQALLLRGHFAKRHKVTLSDIIDEPPRISMQLESLTLGERRAFAKSSQQKKLQMLVYDTDPVVVNNLLDNPRIFEKEVLKIASKRPQASRVLTRMFSHQRWASNYAVRKALVFNPDTPEYLAAGLVNYVQPHDLKLLFEIGALLPSSILERATILLKKRQSLSVAHED